MTEAFTWAALTGSDAIDGTPYMLGDEFEASVTGSVTGVRWRAPDSGSGLGAPCIAKLYRVSDTAEVATSDGAGFTPTGGVNNDIAFVTPFAISAGVRYVAAVLTRRYAYTSGGFPYSSSPAGVMTAQQGRLRTTTAGNPVFPNTTTTLCFHIGPLFEPDAIVVDGTFQAAAPAAALAGVGALINSGVAAAGISGFSIAAAGSLINAGVFAAESLPAVLAALQVTGQPGRHVAGGTSAALTAGGTSASLTASGTP
jgi:hypothetical protein